MQTLYLALEKRYNFSVEDLDIVAYGYHHFRSFFHVKDSGTNSLLLCIFTILMEIVGWGFTFLMVK